MSDNLGSLTIATGRAEHAEMRLAGSENARRLLLEKIEGLETDLYFAVQVAYNRGAVDWVRLNYPKYYDEFKHTPPDKIPDNIG